MLTIDEEDLIWRLAAQLGYKKGFYFYHYPTIIEFTYKPKVSLQASIIKSLTHGKAFPRPYFPCDYELPDEMDSMRGQVEINFYTCMSDPSFVRYKIRQAKNKIKQTFKDLNFEIKFTDVDMDKECISEEDVRDFKTFIACIKEQVKFYKLKGELKNG